LLSTGEIVKKWTGPEEACCQSGSVGKRAASAL
jgi:hypothetical protein